MEQPRAVVREIDGQLVLDDPDALAVMRAVGKHNCKATYDMNRDRIEHFRERARVLGRSAADTVIVILNVDDPNGSVMADLLMPGFDWQAIRDRSEVPFARGLAGREGIEKCLTIFDTEAAEKLRNAPQLSVVVVDHGVAEIF